MNTQNEIGDGVLPSPEVWTSHPLEQYNATPFAPAPYDATPNVVRQHDFPRFGHTNNFAALTTGLSAGPDDAAIQYIVGIFLGAILILVVALAWGLAIQGLQCAGQERVGFLAGRLEHPDAAAGGDGAGTLPAIEEEPSDTESLLESEASSPLVVSRDLELRYEREKKEKRFNRNVLAVRAVFVLSGLLVIVTSILFYAKGVDAFRKSLSSAHSGVDVSAGLVFRVHLHLFGGDISRLISFPLIGSSFNKWPTGQLT